MGNQQNVSVLNMGIFEYIQQQFDRVCRDKTRSHLLISQVLQVKPHEDFPFEFQHLGVLLLCDRQLDGIFTLSDFQYLALWIQLNMQSVQMYEFKSQLQAKAVSKLVQQLQHGIGPNIIVKWFVKMLTEDNKCIQVAGQCYVRIEAIKIIYEVLNIRMMTDMDIQSFFYLIKYSSEELGYRIEQKVEQDEQQQYICTVVCQEFLNSFIQGAIKVLKDIGYTQ